MAGLVRRSVLADLMPGTIEHRFGLHPVSSRDARVQDLSTVFGRRHGRGRD